MIGDVIFIPIPGAIDSLGRANGPVGHALKRWAENVQSLAKVYAPVDTGVLQDSITITYGTSSDGVYADIGTDVDYGGFQELGTVRNPPHPYLRPALAEGMAEIQDSQTFGGYVDSVEGTFNYDGQGDYAGMSETTTIEA